VTSRPVWRKPHGFNLSVILGCPREPYGIVVESIEVDTSINGRRVAAVLDRLADLRGLPLSITADHGPEFEGQLLDAWAHENGVRLSFIRPGKPIENAHIESFNGRFRDECLNEHWFVTLAHARRVIESWRIEYNTERPHSSSGDLTPEEFAKANLSTGTAEDRLWNRPIG
jgi:putative transposase